MTKLYVDAINDPRCIPNVQTAWETFVRGKCDEVKKTALSAYDKIMRTSLSKLPCDEDKILASHESAIDESMTIFREGTFGISTEHTRMDFEELMVRRIVNVSIVSLKTPCSQILRSINSNLLPCYQFIVYTNRPILKIPEWLLFLC